jgi:hypothetical protein
VLADADRDERRGTCARPGRQGSVGLRRMSWRTETVTLELALPIGCRNGGGTAVLDENSHRGMSRRWSGWCLDTRSCGGLSCRSPRTTSRRRSATSWAMADLPGPDPSPVRVVVLGDAPGRVCRNLSAGSRAPFSRKRPGAAPCGGGLRGSGCSGGAPRMGRRARSAMRTGLRTAQASAGAAGVAP